MQTHNRSGIHNGWFLWTILLFIPSIARGQLVGGARWVIGAIHPDPTPDLGAPSSEYLSLYAHGEGAGMNTEGCVLSWNGHERELPVGQWPIGTTLIVHRQADSIHFQAFPMPKLGLASWPALVNGGTLVSIADSTGSVMDAVLYDESALGGGGRPLLRKNPAACGAMANFALWTEGLSPFAPLHLTQDSGLSALESLKKEAEEFDRLIVRAPGEMEWRLPGPMDPRSMLEAQLYIGGVTAESLLWLSDSVLTAKWTDRFGACDTQPCPHTAPVRLGPVRSCVDGDAQGMLRNSLAVFPFQGEVEVVGMLADPMPDDPFLPHEQIVLLNMSDRTLDPASWNWEGARLMRRRLIEGGAMATFWATEFEDWPGLSNAGGEMTLTAPSGSALASWSWSPCSHSSDAFDGKGIPLERLSHPYSDWHTKDHPIEGEEPVALGFGCLRNGMGAISQVQVHLHLPAAFLAGAIWEAITPDETTLALDAIRHPDEPNTLVLSRSDGLDWPLDWPNSCTLKGRHPDIQGDGLGSNGPADFWSIQASCPNRLFTSPLEIRVSEALWNEEDGGGEFVELENLGVSPIDLSGLQASGEAVSESFDWRTWVDGGTSLVLMPGEVMAFGRCPRWYRKGHSAAGSACWPSVSWSALPDDEGSLVMRLPSHGPDPFDRLSWNSDMRGPWWWKSDGWSWSRTGPEPSDWSPSADGGSPGSKGPTFLSDCIGHDLPFELENGLDGLPVLHWNFPSLGHGVLLRMVEWPSGFLRARFVLEMDELQGSWVWDGLDSQGLPMPPGGLIWDIHWWGRTCRGRWRTLIRVPGHR